MSPDKPATHRVTFDVEDGCVFFVRTTCLVEAGGCHMGCPVRDCDWGHGEDFCQHCDAVCGCYCALAGDDSLLSHRQTQTPRHDCWCETALTHRDLGHCPHTFADIGQCWLLPWVQDGDDDWIQYDDQIMDAVRGDRELGDEHPPESWTVDYAGIDGEHEAWWAPADPIMTTLRRVK